MSNYTVCGSSDSEHYTPHTFNQMWGIEFKLVWTKIELIINNNSFVILNNNQMNTKKIIGNLWIQIELFRQKNRKRKRTSKLIDFTYLFISVIWSFVFVKVLNAEDEKVNTVCTQHTQTNTYTTCIMSIWPHTFKNDH